MGISGKAVAGRCFCSGSDGQVGCCGAVTTKDDCMSAWAILMASHPMVHGAFPSITEASRWWWHPIGPSAGTTGIRKFDLQTFGHPGGTAYVAHCGRRHLQRARSRGPQGSRARQPRRTA